MVPCPAPRSPLTDVVHDEPLPLPEDEPSGVRVELDGEVGAGGVELLGAAAADVLPQDAGGELVPIVNGEDVAVGEVQAGKQSSVSLGGWSATRSGAGPRGSEVTPAPPTPLPRAPCPQGVSSPAPPAAALPPAPSPTPCCGCWGGSEPSPRPVTLRHGSSPGRPGARAAAGSPRGAAPARWGWGGVPAVRQGRGSPQKGRPAAPPARVPAASRERCGAAQRRLRAERRGGCGGSTEKKGTERGRGGQRRAGRAGREDREAASPAPEPAAQRRPHPLGLQQGWGCPQLPPQAGGDKRHWHWGQKALAGTEGLSPLSPAKGTGAPSSSLPCPVLPASRAHQQRGRTQHPAHGGTGAGTPRPALPQEQVPPPHRRHLQRNLPPC